MGECYVLAGERGVRSSAFLGVTMRLLLLSLVFSLYALGGIESSPEYVEIHGNGQYTVSQQSKANSRLRSIERDFERDGMIGMAERTNAALRGLMKIAVLNLKRKGHYDTAREVENGWREIDGEIISIVSTTNRNITDFAPWSETLALLYMAILNKLGPQLTAILRIDDLVTFAWTPTVVFDPCRFGKTEFLLHFAGNDPKYGSFMPVTSYWLTNISCTVATFGAGTFWICSPLAFLVEMGAEKVVAPRLGEFIFDRACSH